MSVQSSKRFPSGGRLFVAALALVAPPLLLAGCEDDPFGFNDWELSPDTVLLYSLARPELNLPSGLNINNGQLIRVEAPGASGQWDFFVNTEGGDLVFVPPAAVGIDGRAGLVPMDSETFDTVREAPADTTLYVRTSVVPVERGRLYVLRSNQQSGAFGRRCTYFGKMEPLDVDVVQGTIRLRFDANPICNSRDLVPPED